MDTRTEGWEFKRKRVRSPSFIGAERRRQGNLGFGAMGTSLGRVPRRACVPTQAQGATSCPPASVSRSQKQNRHEGASSSLLVPPAP